MPLTVKMLLRWTSNVKSLCKLRLFSTKNPPDVSELLQEAIIPSAKDARSQTLSENRTVLLFSGQGSQRVGMADSLLQYPNVREMFAVASKILNFDLLGYCQNGPQSELDKTKHCQPAVMVTSLAAVEKLKAEDPAVLQECEACAGFSVGEYAALVFAGALSFEDAVRLIRLRSQAMQEACNRVDSSMVTAVGGKNTQFGQACEQARSYLKHRELVEDPVCNVSAYLCPNVVTIAGHTAAIEYLREIGGAFEIRKLIPIPVSGAFHTKLMKPARVKLQLAMDSIEVGQPLIDVYSNFTGKKYEDPDQIAHSLPRQVVKPVKWEQTVHALLRGSAQDSLPHLFEVGPGQQLGALIKKCNGKAFKQYLPVNPLT